MQVRAKDVHYPDAVGNGVWISPVQAREAAERFNRLYDATGESVREADLAPYRRACRASRAAARDEFLFRVASHLGRSSGRYGRAELDHAAGLVRRWFLL